MRLGKSAGNELKVVFCFLASFFFFFFYLFRFVLSDVFFLGVCFFFFFFPFFFSLFDGVVPSPQFAFTPPSPSCRCSGVSLSFKFFVLIFPIFRKGKSGFPLFTFEG